MALAASLLTALLIFAVAPSASAHDALVSSDPAADSTAETLPEELTLTFSAALIDGEGATAIEVTDAAGSSVTDGAPELDGALVTQPLTTGSAGEYHVIWRVVSSDGHPISGEYSFSVTTGSAPETTPPAEETAAPTPTESSTAAPVTPTANETDAPASSESDGSAWIWIVSILGILVVVGIITWLAIRGRRNPDQAGSDTPAER